VNERGAPLLSSEARRALKQMNIDELFEHQHTALTLGNGRVMEVSEQLGYFQTIQNSTILVLKAMIFWRSTILRNPHLEVNLKGHEQSTIANWQWRNYPGTMLAESQLGFQDHPNSMKCS